MLLFILTKHDIVPIVDVFWLPQKNSTLNATHCTFKSNNAQYGGAIYARVGHRMQNVTVVENRNHHSNDTVVYYKFLELLPLSVLGWTITTHHLNYNIWSGIDVICTELVSKNHPPRSDDAIMALV